MSKPAACRCGGAGNSALPEVNFHAGLPHLVPELERGWLAVVAVGQDGDLAFYSQECGVAAAWCIAAPGGDRRNGTGIYSTVPGGYGRYQGTSMAAPHVSGALAALKSMFPNLGFQDVRDRILFTANGTGTYADPSIYGQGLLDLDAASRPVGGTLFALGGHAGGPVVTTQDARLSLAGRGGVQVPGRRGAPRPRPLSTRPLPCSDQRYAVAGGGGLSMRDLALVAPRRTSADEDEAPGLAIAGEDFQVDGASHRHLDSRRRPGCRTHGRVRKSGRQSAAARQVPHGPERARHGRGVHHRCGSIPCERGHEPRGGGRLRLRGHGLESALGRDGPPLWGARASYALGASFASGLKRPFGLKGTGAFELSGDSVDLGVRHNLFTGAAVRLGVESRLAWLAPDEGALVALDDALLATTELDLSIRLTRRVALHATLSLERPIESGAARIRTARSVGEDGRIDHDDIVIDQGDLLGFERAGHRHELSRRIGLEVWRRGDAGPGRLRRDAGDRRRTGGFPLLNRARNTFIVANHRRV